jgi:phosphohistidine swiveling domain-containing protein
MMPNHGETTRWYRQATAAKFLHLMYPFRSCLALSMRGEQLPVFYDQTVTWLSPDHQFFVYFGTDCLERIARCYADRAVADDSFGLGLYHFWQRERCQPLLRQLAALEAVRFDSLTNLTAQLATVSESYRAMWDESIFHDAFDYAGEPLLAKLAGPDAQAAACAVRHPFPSPYQVERLERWRIAEASMNDGVVGTVRSIKTIVALPSTVQRIIENHAARWHWIDNDYATVRRLGPAEFLSRISSVLTDPDRIDEERRWAAEQTVLPSVEAFAEPTQRFIAFLSLVSVWRDERKAIQQQTVAAIQALIERLAALSQTAVRDLEWLEWSEVMPFIAGDGTVQQRLDARQQGILLTARGRSIVETDGSAGLVVKQSLDHRVDSSAALRGRGAYPGHVTGTARLIFDQRDFHKFQPGDILVAPNTRPEYLPIMRLAKAVVTEEGGLTSHAAIVARELLVPTIIGVQGAITKLRDGDQIEVDSNTGIVRKVVP